MKTLIVIVAAVLVVSSGSALAQGKTETYIIARTGVTGEGAATYRYFEVFQQKGKWIYPDVGYLDFADARDYREAYIGAGGVLFSTKHITVLEEGYIDVATGSAGKGATYFQPWTLVAIALTAKLGAEVVYFPYLPLNNVARIQHVLERAKLEYDLGHVKLGAGYGGYRFGDESWSNRPFVTGTVKLGLLGSLELWLQKMPRGSQVQVRYAKVLR